MSQAGGWRIVCSAAILLAMTAPGQTPGVSVFIDPMIEGLGLSRSRISAAYLVGTLGGAAFLPLVGRWFDRFGARRTTTVIGILFGTAVIAMSTVAGLLTVALGFLGIRMLGQGSLSLASTTTVALWFKRRRGMAIGLSTSLGSALMSLAPLVLAASIGRFDWRVTWVLAGVAVWLVVVPVGWFALRERRPVPDDAIDDAPSARARQQPGERLEVAWTRRDASRTLLFWALVLGVATSSMITTGLAFHQISLLGERGLSVTQAAANFLPQTAAALLAMMATGALVDRVAPRLLVAAAMGLLASSMLLAQAASPGLVAIMFGVAAGAAGGSVRTLEVAAFAHYFGVAHLGEIRGAVKALTVGSTAFGPLLFALGFERYGSYNPILTMLLVAPFAAGLLVVFARTPASPLLE